ncbi:hypothetical protein BH11PLA2_BH11PLA2_33900 [soil metagenome]
MPKYHTFDDVFAAIEYADVILSNDGESKKIAIDTRASNGDTPLHVVGWWSDAEAAKLLVEAGADVNAIGDMSVTPLGVAVRQRNVTMIELLLAAGADPDHVDEFGIEALPDNLRGINLRTL